MAPTQIDSVKQVSRLSAVVKATMKHMGDAFRFFVSSDVHYDSPDCNRELLKEHLSYAANNGMPAFFFGDTFDITTLPQDRRMEYENIRPEYAGKNNLLNAIVMDFADFVRPYLKDGGIPFLFLGKGNHELRVEQRYGIDIRSMVAMALHSNPVVLGDYAGFVSFQMTVNRTKRGSVIMYYHHGKGGSGQASRGVPDVLKQGFVTNVDIVVNGHNHYSYYVPERRVIPLSDGSIKTALTSYLRTPGYKESGILGDNFEKERIPSVKPQGGFEILVFPENDKHNGFSFSHKVIPHISGHGRF